MSSQPPPSPFLVELTELTDPARVGGKARSLARLAEAGLTIPAGFVVTDELFRALCPELPALPVPLDEPAMKELARAAAALDAAPLPAGFSAALAARVKALRSREDPGELRLAVRSSFADEDRAGALAPGVYESRVGVPAAEVESALRAVLRSALGAGAVAYGQRWQRPPAAAPVAVLIHRHVEASAQGSAALDAASGSSPLVGIRTGTLTEAARADLHQALQQLARQLGSVEVEWAAAGDKLVFLQLRPYQPAITDQSRRSWAGFAELPPSEKPSDWHWDAAHNPLPLSPAHAGLVAIVDSRCRIGIRQWVLGGYLFWRTDQPAPSAPAEAATTEGLQAQLTSLAADTEAFRTRLRHRLEARPTLSEALAGFVPLYERLLGSLQPAARAAHAALEHLVRVHLRATDTSAIMTALLGGVPSRAKERVALARRLAATTGPARARALADYLALFGDESPIWDIAAPTWSDDPGALEARVPAFLSSSPPPAPAPDWQAAATKLRASLPPAVQQEFDRRLTAARLAAAIREDDDWIYARIQSQVRQAVLSLGERLHELGMLARPAEAFLLPLEWLLAEEENEAAGQAPAEDLAAEVATLLARGRETQTAARANPPPLARGPSGASPGMVRGSGTGGRVMGRVVQPTSTPSPATVPADAVLVATSLLPTELPLLHAAALVTETGGPLDHVAAQARERGLPAVVGAAGACAQLPTGSLVLVDADSGLVVRLDRPADGQV